MHSYSDSGIEVLKYGSIVPEDIAVHICALPRAQSMAGLVKVHHSDGTAVENIVLGVHKAIFLEQCGVVIVIKDVSHDSNLGSRCNGNS